MKGVIVVVSVLVLALMGGCGIVLANPPLVPPIQYEQFCEAQKVAGTGIVDVSTSIVDKKIALEYYNTMAGDGDFKGTGSGHDRAGHDGHFTGRNSRPVVQTIYRVHRKLPE